MEKAYCLPVLWLVQSTWSWCHICLQENSSWHSKDLQTSQSRLQGTVESYYRAWIIEVFCWKGHQVELLCQTMGVHGVLWETGSFSENMFEKSDGRSIIELWRAFISVDRGRGDNQVKTAQLNLQWTRWTSALQLSSLLHDPFHTASQTSNSDKEELTWTWNYCQWLLDFLEKGVFVGTEIYIWRKHPSINLKEGDLVRSDNKTPCHVWKIGMIEELFLGREDWCQIGTGNIYLFS